MIKPFKNQVLALALVPFVCVGSIERPHALYQDGQEDGYGKFGIRGELLYWKAEWGNVPFALVQTTTTSAPFFTNQTQLNAPFNYKPGFRIGANYEFACDQWDLDFLYTRLVESTCNSAASTTGNLYSTWELALASIPLTSAAATAHQSYQTIDFTLGKKFYWSSPFTLRVYGGFKGALIKERMNIAYTGTITGDAATATTAFVNKYNAFGFMSGASATWDLHRYFALYGRGEIALTEGKFGIQQSELLNSPLNGYVDIALSNCNSFNAIKAGLLSELGIQFNIDICDVSRFILYFGYEFNYWPNQILLTKYNSIGGLPVNLQQQSDLGFQGFNLGLEFEF